MEAKRRRKLRNRKTSGTERGRNIEEEVGRRNWLDMPTEVMTLIFMKLGTVALLGVAQHVCSLWQQLSKQPLLDRSVVIDGRDLKWFEKLRLFSSTKWYSLGGLGCLAVHRGCGQTVQFSCNDMVHFLPRYLDHIAQSSCAVSLKSLRLGICNMTSDELTQIVKNFVSLEELFLYDLFDTPKPRAIQEIGRACPKLKYFRTGTFISSDDKAFAIAQYMPRLQRLHIQGNALTVDGLQAILDGCPCLEYFHLKGLSSDLTGLDTQSLKQHCKRITRVRFLNKNDLLNWEEYEFHVQTTLDSASSSQHACNYALSLCNAPFQDLGDPYVEQDQDY